VGDTLRSAVKAAGVIWSSPRPRSLSNCTIHLDSDYTSCHERQTGDFAAWAWATNHPIDTPSTKPPIASKTGV